MALRAGVLTVSDKGAVGLRADTAGPAVAALLAGIGITVDEKATVPDERSQISATLRAWSDRARLNLIVTVGGTGLSQRDVTPEATLDVAERNVPGIAEAMRQLGRASTPLASLSRAVAVNRGATLIVNLPGSEKGARESLEAVLDLVPHAAELLSGPVEHS